MNNPVLAASASVTGSIVFVKALINLVRAMMWFDLTEEQWNAWSIFFETVIPIGAVWVSYWWVSRTTTPLSKPVDTDGVSLSRPDNTPAKEELKVIQSEAILMNAAR